MANTIFSKTMLTHVYHTIKPSKFSYLSRKTIRCNYACVSRSQALSVKMSWEMQYQSIYVQSFLLIVRARSEKNIKASLYWPHTTQSLHETGRVFIRFRHQDCSWVYWSQFPISCGAAIAKGSTLWLTPFEQRWYHYRWCWIYIG